ncbi:MAG: hypothetical protein B6I20_02275 [Bacteroidetes bacterium 4572_117]|nr:MAG: hypothetical protein B6I20_02275 [Bacteroidetes bacterium 4572_117]
MCVSDKQHIFLQNISELQPKAVGWVYTYHIYFSSLFYLFKNSLKHYVLIVFFVFVNQFPQVFAQQTIIPLQNELNYRFEKEFFASNNIHLNIKPFAINKKETFDSLNNLLFIETKRQSINILLNNNSLLVNKKNLFLTLNPIINTIWGIDIKSNNYVQDSKFGLAINAHIGKKTSLQINGFYGIRSFTKEWNNIVDSTKIIPHYGKILNKHQRAYDYIAFDGNISYMPWKHLNIQIGKGKNFWGEGYRSLFLSDNSNSYPYSKITIDIWRFKYIWMVGALRDFDSERNTGKLYPKLQFSHYLSWNATKWLNFNFFESIISNPIDSAGVHYFNINYLNPVSFFRPVEFAGGSADNAILGIGLKLKIWKKYHLYSQLLIDEFVFSEIKSGNGWWGNKYGIQTGLKIFNPLNIRSLMLLVEFNLIRPYTYSYSNSIQNYGNYMQPLAHPSGANLKEGVAIVHYHNKRFSSQIKGVFQITGVDSDTISHGKDIYRPYGLRPDDYNHNIAQGLLTKHFLFEFKSGWIINPKHYTQLQFIISAKRTNPLFQSANEIFFLFGIKSLIFNEIRDFD